MRKIVHHDVMDSYPNDILENMSGVVTYAGRVFASTSSGDVLVLPPETLSESDWVRSHYEEIGLDCAQEILFGGYELLEHYPKHELSVFFFGEKANRARFDDRWFNMVKLLNNKNNFIKAAQALGVKTPKTTCYRAGESVLIPRQFPVYVKLAVSASGFGVWPCQNNNEFGAVVDQVTAEFQVQEALPEGTIFLNVQYSVSDLGALEIGPVTEQTLEGSSHSGNIFPTPYANLAQATTLPLAKWAQQEGMKGVFAYDVAVTPSGDFLPIECNPRWNGATYYSKVADKLKLQEWQSVNVSFKPRTFEKLDLSDLSFDQQLGEGIIIINWGPVGQGKLGLLVAGNQVTRDDYLAEFNHRFG